MIPKEITRDHIIEAALWINANPENASNVSRKFAVLISGIEYSPKTVIRRAAFLATGMQLSTNMFSGGKPTNRILQNLGFEVINKQPLLKAPRPPVIKRDRESIPKNIKAERTLEIEGKCTGESCSQCKVIFLDMLKSVFGEVITQYRPDIPYRLQKYENSSFYAKLLEIYNKIRDRRSNDNFDNGKENLVCDYYLPAQKTIVEFDESQHFTELRRISLEAYPSDLKIAYDHDLWINLCGRLDRHDNHPVNRDETRAWYDTLRDFAPYISGLNPTIRVYSRMAKWCSMNSENQDDIEHFEKFVQVGNFSKSEKSENPHLARIIFKDEWNGNLKEARDVLKNVCNHWGNRKRARCLITCGAFVTFPSPEELEFEKGKLIPSSKILDHLIVEAEKTALDLLAGGMRERLAKHFDCMTIGIDTKKNEVSTQGTKISDAHAEMVVLADLNSNKLWSTGKTYPTPGQEKSIIRFPDMERNFISFDWGTIMLLGCHDLAIFCPRANKIAGNWRRQILEDFQKIAKAKMPTLVIQHPHTTVKQNTWSQKWHNLLKILPSVRAYSSAGGYWSKDGESSTFDAIEKCRRSTNLGQTIDIEVTAEDEGFSLVFST